MMPKSTFLPLKEVVQVVQIGRVEGRGNLDKIQKNRYFFFVKPFLSKNFLPSPVHCCTHLSVGMSWDDQDKEPMIDTNNKDHIDGQLITRYHPTWICTFLTRLPLSHSEVRNGLVTWEDTWKWFDWFCSWMLCTWASGWLRVEVSILILTLA